MISHQEILEQVSKISIQLLLNEPFYGHFFTGIVKTINKEVPTAGVRSVNNLTIEMALNKKYWLSLSPQHQYGLIKHEVLHIALKHITQHRNENIPIALLANIAADLVVNQYIDKQHLPPGGIQLSKFQNMGSKFDISIEAHKDVDYYYQKLKEIMDKGGKLPGEYICKEKLENASWEQKPHDLDDIFEKAADSVRNHANWDSFDKMDDAQKEIVSAQIDNLLKNANERVGTAMFAGNVPASLLEQINALINASKANLDWRRALRMFTASSARTYLKNTLRRKSKRYGTTPGIKIKSYHHILVGVDTSGSMNIVEIEEFFSEIHHIWRQGAQVTVVEFDYEIQNSYAYKGEPPSQVKGRGGTSFDPVIELANEQLHPDILIIFTDGYIDKIELNSRKPLMWMISTQGITGDTDYWSILEEKGRVIKMQSQAIKL
ncbi:MAG: VWA-like domain-containing protein [Marinifilaceae bacterium]|jgi:predicted metal-dependent peptidase|nr:VWA-like domain-containing protein [Marinifilaceae bacterium]